MSNRFYLRETLRAVVSGYRNMLSPSEIAEELAAAQIGLMPRSEQPQNLGTDGLDEGFVAWRQGEYDIASHQPAKTDDLLQQANRQRDDATRSARAERELDG